MTPLARYRTAATRHAFRGCDPLTQSIVHAIAGGREVPEEFAITAARRSAGRFAGYSPPPASQWPAHSR